MNISEKLNVTSKKALMNIGEPLSTPPAIIRPRSHFITSNHTVNHMLLIPLEKLYTKRDSVRKARETFLIYRGNTLEPGGLNRRNENNVIQPAFSLSLFYCISVFISCIFQYFLHITLPCHVISGLLYKDHVNARFIQ